MESLAKSIMMSTQESNIKPSGPVSRPVGELLKYIFTLETMIKSMQFEDGSHFHDWQFDILKNVICPHWDDAIDEVSGLGKDIGLTTVLQKEIDNLGSNHE